jgi:methyl-accepting chemotaxis protein
MSMRMTIGRRISFGFMVVVLIMVCVGGMAMLSMLSAKQSAVMMAEEYAPEVEVASNMRGAANRLMYQMRGYSFSGDRAYKESADEEMAALKNAMAEGEQLAQGAIHLEALTGHLDASNTAMRDYEDCMHQTSKAINAIESLRSEMDTGASAYMGACAEFLESQNTAFNADLDDRLAKNELAARIVNLGTIARVNNFKAQASGDLSQMNEASAALNDVADAIAELRSITRDEDDIARIDDVESAADGYGRAINSYLIAAESIAAQCAAMDEAASQYMEHCAAYLDRQNAAMLREIERPGADLPGRLEKITAINDIIDLGNTVRVANQKAQARKDTGLLDQALADLNKVAQLLAELRTATREEENLKSIAKIEEAAGSFRTAIDSYRNAVKTCDASRDDMDQTAGIYVSRCDEFMVTQQAKLKKDMNEGLEKITLANDVIDIGNATRVAAFKAQATRTPETMRDAIVGMAALTGKYKALREITRMQKDLDSIQRTEQAGESYASALNQYLEEWSLLTQLDERRTNSGNMVLKACAETAEAGMANMSGKSEEAASTLTRSSAALGFGLAIGIVLAIAFAVLITRTIVRPIRKVVDRIKDIAQGEGDLTKRVDQDRRDEMGELGKWFNTFVEKIENIICDIAGGAAQIDGGSEQVSASSQSLSEGASEQAASLQQISSSLEEIAAMTNQNAEHVQQASSLGDESKSAAERGRDEMTSMTAAMSEIKASSDEISKIMKVIDEIAFQTNLLALNAAVEAARAGEAGKGFAVVAEEVRTLAQRSAEAAKDTSQMIEQATMRADNGVAIADRVGTSLEEIAASTTKVTTLLNEIASASKEQAQGINQVNDGVTQLDTVTQQNAGNSEELASAAEETSAQATAMRELVGSFKYRDTSGSASERVAVARSAGKSLKTQAPTSEQQIPFNGGEDIESF